MAHYVLYLDEINPKRNIYNYFCLAGVVIESELFSTKVNTDIQRIKRETFDGNENVLIHATEIHAAARGTEYERFQTDEVRVGFWNKISVLFQETHLKMFSFGVAIDSRKLNTYYRNSRDHYFISLQVILENYVQFLEKVNGYGDIYLETRDTTQNDRLQQHFYTLKALGTLFYNPLTIQSRIGTIKFLEKNSLNPGLEIADLVANTINRDLSGVSQKSEGLINEIKKSYYHGYTSQPQRFGLKVIP